jgi:hypothetical protein
LNHLQARRIALQHFTPISPDGVGTPGSNDTSAVVALRAISRSATKARLVFANPPLITGVAALAGGTSGTLLVSNAAAPQPAT